MRATVPSANLPFLTRDASPHLAQISMTLESSIGIGFSMIPPWNFWVARWCRLATLTRSTSTLPLPGMTRRILPFFPRSLPLKTSTWSPFFNLAGMVLSYLRGQRYDLHIIAVAQLARHGAKNARPDGVPLLVDEHRRVIIKTDIGTVRPPDRF